MNEFRMNGVPIRHERQFRRWFSPTDLLRQRELAAGFVMQAMLPMSLSANFHSSQLYRAVFQGLPGQTAHWSDYNDPYEQEGEEELLSSLWELLTEGEPPSDRQITMFWILAAGYLLAGRTPEDTPLTREEAEYAFDRQALSEALVDFPPIPSEGPILLRARVTPYRLVLDSGRGKELLEQGNPITPRKLIAVIHPQGERSIPVVMEIYDSPGDPAPRRILLPVGEYLYCNFVKDIPIHLHPTKTLQGDVTMSRVGDLITISAPNQNPVTISCSGREILTFFPEEDGTHWLILDTEKLDYRHYSLRDAHRTKLRWATDIVEISLNESNVLLLLDERGHLISTDSYDHPRATPFPRLADLPRDTGGI